MALTKVHNRLIEGATLNVKDFGAVGDGVADDTSAIQAAINAMTAGGVLYLPEGTYRTTSEVSVSLPINHVHIKGAQQYATVILADHNGNAFTLATNNQPRVSNLYIKKNTIGTRGSRTGVGMRVFGDFGAGSSIQAKVDHCRIEGFGKGLDIYGAFLSYFSDLTLKKNDISYYLNNNTNDSITFFNCASNLDISQHVVCDGGTAETGATFVTCEFEGSYKFPAISCIGAATRFQLQFLNCYLYENNVGTDFGSTFNFFKFDVPGWLKVIGSGVSCAGLTDARLVLGRKNGSALEWHIVFDNCFISSDRATSPDIDVDTGSNANDVVYVSPSCIYSNPDNASTYLTTEPNSLYQNRAVFAQQSFKQLWANRDQFIQGVANGHQFNAATEFNWENNCLVFAQNSGGAIHYLWVDTSGKLRIKASAPTSDTDGTVVGTQT
jgi:hypothetical protein